ncbi:MAG: thiamine pyrophosphate-binding protein, partial [Solirubrobacterales bacterium]|nr:thiamine pyrophosphate-binding protein [Solirubrobacterales bacterium]
WTAVHARLALLTVVLDNREYRNTVDHAERVGTARGRPRENRRSGAVIDDPPVDHAAMARSMGMWATGPIATFEEIAPAVESALAKIDAGRPALIHVLTPRG